MVCVFYDVLATIYLTKVNLPEQYLTQGQLRVMGVTSMSHMTSVVPTSTTTHYLNHNTIQGVKGMYFPLILHY
jgi:hypothetical protein